MLQKKHLFVQKSWDITTSSKQTRSFYMRIAIKTLVILRMLFAYMSPESIRTHGCSRISILFSVILNSSLQNLSHVFYSSHSACYVWLCSFWKLRSCCLILKLKQHKLETLQVRSSELWVNNEYFQSSIQKCLLRFKFFKSNRIEAVRK